MKRTRLSRELWTCITDRSVRLARADLPGFRGVVCCLDVRAVSAPQIWRRNGADVPVCVAGSRWVELLPEAGGFCVTAMLGPDRAVRLWYIDMIAGQGVDADGVPWFDDLYLDLIVWPDGEVQTDDRDELDAALVSGEIAARQHAQALRTAAALQNGPLGTPEGLRALTDKALNLFGASPQDKAEDTHG